MRRRPLGTLLLLQGAFMVGFAAVVPYLAVIAQERFALDAAAVGALVGARVAAQQGMFVAGGALADRFGPRRLVVVGCAVRALGLAVVGLATAVALFAVGVVLVGAAGALFSPAIDSMVGAADAQAAGDAAAPGPSPFAALALVGEAGGVVGLAVGAALVPGSAATAALGAAAVFLLALALATRLPGPTPATSPRAAVGEPAPGTGRARAGAPASAASPWLLVLLVAAGTLLAVYTQLATLVPTALDRRSLDAATLALLLTLYSVLVLVLQWPVSRLAHRWGPARAIPAALLAAGAAALVAAAGERLAPQGGGVLVALVLTVALVAVAMTLGGPAAQTYLAATGRPESRGLRLGALATAGGLLALAVSASAGALADRAGPAQAWLTVAVLAGVAALAARRAVTRLDRAAAPVRALAPACT